MKTENGFTLVELMVTMTVAVILLAVAVPAFHDFVQRNRITAAANELVTAINLARDEALKRRQTVSICHSDDQVTCGGNWIDGWIIFVDLDADGVIDTGTPGIPDDEVLRVWDALPAGSVLAATPASLQYSGIGLVNTAADFELRIPERSGDQARCIRIGVTGHPSVSDNTCV